MTLVRKTLAELKAEPPTFSPSQRARLEAMSPEEIDRNAEADLENPPMTDDQMERAVFARSVRQAREKADMTQSVFAERFRITLSRLRDWERGRYRPDSVAEAYIKAIRHDPKAIERALKSKT